MADNDRMMNMKEVDSLISDIVGMKKAKIREDTYQAKRKIWNTKEYQALKKKAKETSDKNRAEMNVKQNLFDKESSEARKKFDAEMSKMRESHTKVEDALYEQKADMTKALSEKQTKALKSVDADVIVLKTEIVSNDSAKIADAVKKLNDKTYAIA
jgi:hypothetical protein